MTEIDPFNIRAIVPDFAAQMDGYLAASDETRARRRSQLDIQYGPAPRQRLDLFFPDDRQSRRPIHVFIHGGYWRAQQKEHYAFVAEGVLAMGAIAAIVEYSLLPAHRMAQLIAETRSAVNWLAQHAEEFGGDATCMSASGHSAGAHLCSFLVSQGSGEAAAPLSPIKSVLLLSGIYDLVPITRSYLQPEVQLTKDEAVSWSPLRASPAATTRFALAIGAQETAPFHQQTERYEQRLRQAHAPVCRQSIAGHEHMSIVSELGHLELPLGQLLLETIGQVGP